MTGGIGLLVTALAILLAAGLGPGIAFSRSDPCHSRPLCDRALDARTDAPQTAAACKLGNVCC